MFCTENLYNTTLLSMFQEVKPFELKCREKIKAIVSWCLVKELSAREVVGELT